MVPGSTFKYGSNFIRLTRSPRLSSKQPSEAAARPFPRLDTTPPVTKMYLADIGAAPWTGICVGSYWVGTIYFRRSRNREERNFTGPGEKCYRPRGFLGKGLQNLLYCSQHTRNSTLEN